MLGLSSNLTQTVFVYLFICVFVFVYLAPQPSDLTNLAKKMPVRFLQLFCWCTLNGLRSVKIIFPLSCSYFKVLGETAVGHDFVI